MFVFFTLLIMLVFNTFTSDITHRGISGSYIGVDHHNMSYHNISCTFKG